MNLAKIPSWVIIILCIMLGIFASYKAQQLLRQQEIQLWIESAHPDSQKFIDNVSKQFAIKINLLNQFSAILMVQPNSTKEEYTQLAKSMLQQSAALDEISLGYYTTNNNRFSHKWTFGSARSYQSDALRQAELIALFNQSKQLPNEVVLKKSMTDKANHYLLAGLYVKKAEHSYFVFSQIDLELIKFGLLNYELPKHLAFDVSLYDSQNNEVLNWQFNDMTLMPNMESVVKLTSNYHWKFKTSVLNTENFAPNHIKSTRFFHAGIVLSLFIGLLASLLAWLRYCAEIETKKAKVDTEKHLFQLSQYQDSCKNNAQTAVFSKLAPIAINAMSHNVSNSIKAISSLEERAHHLKANIRENKATKIQYNQFVDNTIILTRGSAENMLKTGEIIYNLNRISDDLQRDPLRKIHLQTHLDEIVTTIKPAYTHVNFIVTVPQELLIENFSGSLTQVLTIFIENSLIHGFKNQTNNVLMIEAFTDKKTDDISIRIEDNGNGIEAELLAFINNKQFPLPCVGVGISTAQKIITNQLNAKLEIKSKQTRYTRITINFPNAVIETNQDEVK